MIKMSRKAKKAMAVALTAGMLASTAATPVMAATAGWKQNAKGWWYENADGTYPANKWQSINGKWYYFDANGYMASGWQPIGGKWYYLGTANDGAMKDGWFKDTTGQWSYAEPGKGAIYQDGWKQEPNGDWYYLKPNGYMHTGGWAPTGGKWYFFDNNGIMQTGWIQAEDKTGTEYIYYLTKDGDMVTNEQVIDGVTYTFDSTGACTSETKPEVTKAFKNDGTPVAVKEEEKALSITSVTAITKNENEELVLTALLNQTVSADKLKDTTLTLVNGSIVVTAKYASVDGAFVTYKITDSSKLTPGDSSANGSYVVTANGIDVASSTLTAAYEETLVGNAVQGIVYYEKSTGVNVPISYATVTVGGKEVTADVNGYYSIASTSGIATVKVTAAGYFENDTTTVKVSRNYPSALNVKLEEYDQEKLFINGTVVNEKTSAPVGAAKVELHKKNSDGKYVKIADVVTGNSGEFVFMNDDSKDDYTSTTLGTNAKYDFATEDDNSKVLSEDDTYKIVISKAYNDGNLYDAYHTTEYAVEMNQYGAQTNLKTKSIKPVAKLDSATLSMSWDTDITCETTADLTVTFIDVDGEKTLASNPLLSLAVDKNAMENVETLIGAGKVFTDAPTLPAGNYALIIEDKTATVGADVAKKVIVVKVEEGGKISASGVFQKATKGNVKTTVTNLKYDPTVKTLYTVGKGDTENPQVETNAPVIGEINESGNASQYESEEVKVKYKVYQEAKDMKDGKVLVYETASPDVLKYLYTGDDKTTLSIQANTGLDKLEAGVNYICVPESEFVTATSVTVKNEENTNSFDEANKVKAAGKIAKLDLSEVTFKNEEGGLATVSKAKILSVEVLDTKGNVVAVADDLDSGYTETTISSAEDLSGVFDDVDNLSGLAAGEYKVRVTLDGYEAFTTNTFDLIDFQAATVSTAGTTAKKIVKTTLTGALRYEDGTAVNEEVSIVIYDANGIAVGALYDDYESADSNVYTLSDGLEDKESVSTTVKAVAKLSAGTYTVVVRGEGFETLEKKIQLEANAKNVQDLVLTKHEGGRVKLSIYDSNNVPYGATNASKIWLLDENYVALDNSVRDKYDVLSDVFTGEDANFYGKFAVKSESAFEFISAKEDSLGNCKDILSKGSYIVSVDETDLAKGNGDANKVTIASIDATQYVIIGLDAKTNKKEIPLTVTFSTSSTVSIDTQFDWVVVKDSKGDVVAVDDEAGVAGKSVVFQVGANDTYTVEVYANGCFVGSEKVSVQDFSKSVSVTLDEATRD